MIPACLQRSLPLIDICTSPNMSFDDIYGTFFNHYYNESELSNCLQMNEEYSSLDSEEQFNVTSYIECWQLCDKDCKFWTWTSPEHEQGSKCFHIHSDASPDIKHGEAISGRNNCKGTFCNCLFFVTHVR